MTSADFALLDIRK